MQVEKLSSVDGFVIFDLDDVPASGVARVARKVLQSSSTWLARTVTYSFALFDVDAGGASAALNVADDADRETAIAAFVDELRPMVESGRLSLDPSLGFEADDLAPLQDVDRRGDVMGHRGELATNGAVAAAGAVVDLDGARVAVSGDDDDSERAQHRLAELDIELVDDVNNEGVDVLFTAGKAGHLDHVRAAEIGAQVLVPLTPLAVTAKAHAELERRNIVHVPDFLALAAPLLAGRDPDGGDPIERVATVTRELADVERGLWWAAIERAESNLRSRYDQVPFGRPLA